MHPHRPRLFSRANLFFAAQQQQRRHRSFLPFYSRSDIGRVVRTGAVAIIVVVGAITGANLKSDRESAQKHQEYYELSLDDRIEALEKRRATLVAAKAPMDKKLAVLQERMAAEERKKKEA